MLLLIWYPWWHLEVISEFLSCILFVSPKRCVGFNCALDFLALWFYAFEKLVVRIAITRWLHLLLTFNFSLKAHMLLFQIQKMIYWIWFLVCFSREILPWLLWNFKSKKSMFDDEVIVSIELCGEVFPLILLFRDMSANSIVSQFVKLSSPFKYPLIFYSLLFFVDF